MWVWVDGWGLVFNFGSQWWWGVELRDYVDGVKMLQIRGWMDGPTKILFKIFDTECSNLIYSLNDLNILKHKSFKFSNDGNKLMKFYVWQQIKINKRSLFVFSFEYKLLEIIYISNVYMKVLVGLQGILVGSCFQEIMSNKKMFLCWD